MLLQLQDGKKVVGLKQSTKALKDGAALCAFVAQDADKRILSPFLELCSEQKVPITEVSTMLELGAACGIDVAAAVAVLLP